MSRPEPSYEFRPNQSIPSMLVDLACIGAVVYLAIKGVREPAVWSILSGLMIGRFGVSHSKAMERSGRGGGDSGTWSRGEVVVAQPPPSSEEPRPRRPIPREDPRRSVLAAARLRLAAWAAARRGGLPWWARRGVGVPGTGLRVDLLSAVVVVVLAATLATTLASGQSARSNQADQGEARHSAR